VEEGERYDKTVKTRKRPRERTLRLGLVRFEFRRAEEIVVARRIQT